MLIFLHFIITKLSDSKEKTISLLGELFYNGRYEFEKKIFCGNSIPHTRAFSGKNVEWER